MPYHKLFIVLTWCINICAHGSATPVDSAAEQTAQNKPNLLVIVADDLGFSDLGYFGSEIATPNLDRLANNGLSLTQFYVHPRCSPTRAALMTGVDPHSAGLAFLTVPANLETQPGPYQGYLSDNLPTLPEVLRSAGYATYMSGKWHLGENPSAWPRQRGFDRYFGLISGASSYYELLTNQRMQRRMALDDQAWSPPDQGFYMTEAITDKAIDYLTEHAQKSAADKPFFMYLAYTAPHWPLHAPAKDIEPYRGHYASGPAAVHAARAGRMKKLGLSIGNGLTSFGKSSTRPDWEERMEVYAAMVTNMDRGIGRVVAYLQRRGSLDNTLILFFSDNGASAELVASRRLHQTGSKVGERGSYRAYGPDWASVSNTPLHRHKGTTHEGGIRTPIIFHWPDGISSKGSVDQKTVAVVQDIMPTAVQVAGGVVPSGSTGHSLAPFLRDRKQAATRPLFWEHADWRAVRNGKWKAVFDPDQHKWSLYNLQIDPTETEDQSAVHPQQLEQMADAWQTWADGVGVLPFGETPFGQLYKQQRAESEG